MIYKKVEIKVEGYQETADLYTYILDNSVEMRPDRKRPVIVICPGGGYTMTSDREAEPIAMQYLARGYHAVILRYSVAPARYPLALLQLAKSVAYLREHAEEFHISSMLLSSKYLRIVLRHSSAGLMSPEYAAAMCTFLPAKRVCRSFSSAFSIVFSAFAMPRTFA